MPITRPNKTTETCRATCHFSQEWAGFGARGAPFGAWGNRLNSHDVDFYREQAKRMRQIAAKAASLDITMQLVAIAQQFERLAAFVAKEERRSQ